MTLRSAIITGTASININGTVGATTPTTGKFTTIEGTDTTDATSTTAAAVKTAGGLAVAKKVYVGDNVVPAAAKGVNFTGNTPAAGMTSQLLNWYEEGTWTPTLSASAGTITTPGASTATYTRVGRNVTLSIDAAITINGTAALVLFITGIPFAGSTATVTYYSGSGEERSTGFALSVEYQPSNSRISVYTYAGLYPGGNNTRFIISVTYQI